MENDIRKFVGRKIKEFRKKNRIKQDELGKMIGVNQTSISGYENGEWEVSYDNLFKLADIFNVSVDDFFPPTKHDLDYKPLEETLNIDDVQNLNYKDLELIKKITEKALTLEEEERKKLLNNIKLAVDLYDQMGE